MLRRVTIERQSDGTWTLLRERDPSAVQPKGNGETFPGLVDLERAFSVILAAYLPDGSPRKQLYLPDVPVREEASQHKGGAP